jgi:hypothetical protein
MAIKKIGQTRPYASVIEALDKKLPAPLETFQDFPEPLAYYSLYCIIEKKRKCNEKPDKNFRPFKKRNYSQTEEVYADHLFWVRTLENFLGERLVYSNAIHRAKLTDFGKKIYGVLMEAFWSLYEKNQIFMDIKASYDKKVEEAEATFS